MSAPEPNSWDCTFTFQEQVRCLVNTTDFQHINGEDMTSNANRATAKVYTDTVFPACSRADDLANTDGEEDDGLPLRSPPSLPMRRKSMCQYYLRRDVIRLEDVKSTILALVIY